MRIEADLQYHPASFQPYLTTCQIAKVVELPDEEFSALLQYPMKEHRFIAENLSYIIDRGRVIHSLMALGQGRNDGVIIAAEGRVRAEYAAYLPEARSTINKELDRAADFIIQHGTERTGTESWCVCFEELQEHLGLNIQEGNGLDAMLKSVLERRPEIASVDMHSDFLTLVNQYVDISVKDPRNIAAKAKAEKYAKILAKTIISPDGDSSNRGQNAFFYDAAEGLLTSVILLLAEFLPPKEIEGEVRERRHIVSVFKLVQDLLEPATGADKGKSQFQVLMSKLPSEHKARWFAGAALNTSEQAMASVLSTVLSCLNSFLDSELEQVLCFESSITAESFARKKSAVFLILPEEDPSKNFMAGLMIQQLSRELFAVADENGGKLPNRVVFFCDELGTMPPFDILPLFSAGRSRELTLVPIIQSLAQLEKNYGKEGAEILTDNCQDTIFGGFAPNSQTAEVLSKALGNQTVQSGYISKAKDGVNQSLQMVSRPLMSSDELKAIPKGSFIVMKTGTNPMRTRLRLFLDWGISFGDAYQTPEHGQRKVYYADRGELEAAILKKYPRPGVEIIPQATAVTANQSRSRQTFHKTDKDESSLRT